MLSGQTTNSGRLDVGSGLGRHWATLDEPRLATDFPPTCVLYVDHQLCLPLVRLLLRFEAITIIFSGQGEALPVPCHPPISAVHCTEYRRIHPSLSARARYQRAQPSPAQPDHTRIQTGHLCLRS